MAFKKKGISSKDIDNLSRKIDRNKIIFDDDDERKPGIRKDRIRRGSRAQGGFSNKRASSSSRIFDVVKRGLKRKQLERKRLRKLKKVKTHSINRNIKAARGKAELSFTTNIDLRKLAQLAAKRRERQRIDKIKNPRSQVIKMKEKKQRWDEERKDTITGKLVASSGEYVLMDGYDYEGYYHIHDDGVAYTEPTFVQGKSQPLVTKEKYKDNKAAYELITEKMGIKNPYNTVTFEQPKKSKKVTKGLVK
tara:strand:- start:1511 stop:2257 length:747 start_codon:yes stop_codon:yes gene_type:complete